jgi:hypothetical protein
MRRAVIVMGIMSVVGWWWLRSRHAPAPGAAETGHVLADLAADRGPIRWNASADRRGASDGIELTAIQTAPATVTVTSGTATVETGAWRIVVALSHVTEIVCERRFIHHPPPGTVLLDMSFRKGPDDEDGFPDELLTVSFPEAREADFRTLCARHGLRTVGDGW